MIELQPDEARTYRSSLQAYICDELSHFSVDRSEAVNLSEALAESIEIFSVENTSTSMVSHPLLSVLIARSLWSLGHDFLSEQYLDRTHTGILRRRIGCYVHSHIPVKRELVEYIRAEILKPFQSEMWPDNTSWMLNLAVLQNQGEVMLEMMRSTLLQKLLTEVIPLYRQTSGRGVLVFRRRAARDRREPLLYPWPDKEIIDQAAEFFKRQKEKLGWIESPDLFIMDVE